MTRLLWIPVTGTVAAFIAILLAHQPRDFHEEAAAESREERLPVEEADLPAPPQEEPDRPPPPPPPPPKPVEYQLRLEADGTFLDLETGQTFDDAKELVEGLAADDRVRNRILLSNGVNVAEEALDRMLEKLSEKFEVRKVYRAPQEDG